MLERTKTCPTCGKHFSYAIGRGNDRKHCSKSCRLKFREAKKAERHELLPTCSTPGCDGKATRVKAEQCEKCYGRVRRNGTTTREYRYRYRTGAGYIKVLRPDHPLADSDGNVSEHRVVAFDRYGSGVQSCHWCGKPGRWDEMVVDHLNEVKDDNRIENLVVACNGCNRARGALLPFVERMRAEVVEELFDCVRAHRRRVGKRM